MIMMMAVMIYTCSGGGGNDNGDSGGEDDDDDDDDNVLLIMKMRVMKIRMMNMTTTRPLQNNFMLCTYLRTLSDCLNKFCE